MLAMKSYANAIGLLVGVAMLAGCASTNVTQQTRMTARGLARPNQIWVYHFVAASSDMPAGSSLAGRVGAPSTPPTPEEIETGRKYGAMIAQELVRDIQAMGMPAIEAGPGASPQVGDGIIRGYIVSTEGGGAGGMVKRMVIGFGSGTAEMDTVVEGYVVTPQGLRKLGSGTLTSSGNKSRGLMRAQFRESMHVMVVRYKYSNSICFSGRRIDETKVRVLSIKHWTTRTSQRQQDSDLP